MSSDITQDANAQALSATTSSFITSLIVNSVVAGVEIAAFIVIRRKLRAVYEPRAYMPPEKNRVQSLTKSWLGVFWQIYKSDASLVLKKNGVDAYCFIRFHRLMLIILIPIWLISWVILFPLNSVGTRTNEKEGVDRLTFGNVDGTHQSRYWGHLVLAYVFSFWIYYNIRKEMTQWVLIRQKYLINPNHSALAQANTVLITGISRSYLDEERLAQLFHHLPGGIKKIWLNRDLKEMAVVHQARVKATHMLEDAQVALVKQAVQQKLKREKTREKETSKGRKLKDDTSGDINKDILGGGTSPSALVLAELGRKVRSNEVLTADRLVPRASRPQHRVGAKWWLPFSGTKVDTIDWARREVVRTSQILETDRKILADDISKPGTEGEKYPPLNSAFIYFHQQIAAHMAAQIVLHDQPYRMTGHYLEVAPEDVIWSNLGIDPYWAQIRRLGSYAITAGLVIFWSFPSTFIGALANLSRLCPQWSWLAWLCEAPSIVQGIIQGVLPPVLLAVLNLLLPIILRLLARFEGIPRKTSVELSLMTRYTIFLVFNSFLVVTLSSGIVSAFEEIGRNPSSVATILASQLPLASTFFLTFVMQRAAGAAGNLLQIITIVFYFIKLILQGGTPRSVFKQKYSMQTPTWGETFPNSTIIAIIGIAYMIISPVITGFAVAAFALSYIIYKYLYTWVIDQPPHSDTGGLFFPKAITHLFCGLYIQQIALCALFFLARNADGKVSAIPQGALMVVLCVMTLAFQYGIVHSYSSLQTPLPLSLAYLSYGMPKETGHTESDPQHQGDFQSGDFEAERDRVQQEVTLAKKSSRASLPAPPGLNRRSSARTLPQPEDADHGTRRDNHPEGSDQERQTMELANMGQKTNEKAGQLDASNTLQQGDKNDTAQREWEQHMSNMREQGKASAGMTNRDDENDHERTGEMQARADLQNGSEGQAYDESEGVVETSGRNKTEFASDAFAHPASKEPLRTIWLPEDDLGLASEECRDNRSIGITSTCADAYLNRKGKVEITGPPPDDFEGTDE